MKIDQFMDALQEIDEKYILEARGLEQAEEAKTQLVGWCVAAAALFLTLIGGALFFMSTTQEREQPPLAQESDEIDYAEQESQEAPPDEILVQGQPELDLPRIAIARNTADGMGYLAYNAYDFSEIKISNPWSEEMEIEYLPVYKNPWELDNMFASPIRDEEAMTAELYRVAELLGIDVSGVDIEREGDADEHLAFTLKTEAVRIDVDEVMAVDVSFRKPVKMPEVELSEEYYTSYEEYEKAAKFVLEEYANLLEMEEPTIEIQGGARSFSGKQSWWIVIYEGAGETIEEKLTNYFFNNVTFSLSYGELSYIRFDEVTKTEKVGDYPIITVEEAKEKLAQGGYLTSVPYDMPGLEYVAGVELAYDTLILQDYYVPYYKFYVEIEQDSVEAAELGLKSYGVYLVPAVEEKYLYFTDDWYSGF